MKWSDEPPKGVGDYLYRLKLGQPEIHVSIKSVGDGINKRLLVRDPYGPPLLYTQPKWMSGQWAGPIPKPEEI